MRCKTVAMDKMNLYVTVATVADTTVEDIYIFGSMLR